MSTLSIPVVTPVRESRKPILWPVVALTSLLAALAFILSFVALRELAEATGIQPGVAWMFPLVIDGFIICATWAAWGMRDRPTRTRVYTWTLLTIFVLVSVLGNMAHAHPIVVDHIHLSYLTARLLSSVPPFALMFSTHLLTVLARPNFSDTPSSPEQEHATSAPAARVSRVDHVTPVEHNPMTSPDFNAPRPTYMHTFETVPKHESKEEPRFTPAPVLPVTASTSPSVNTAGMMATLTTIDTRVDTPVGSLTPDEPGRTVLPPVSPAASPNGQKKPVIHPATQKPSGLRLVTSPTSDTHSSKGVDFDALTRWLAPYVVAGKATGVAPAARLEFPELLKSDSSARRVIKKIKDEVLTSPKAAEAWLASNPGTASTASPVGVRVGGMS